MYVILLVRTLAFFLEFECTGCWQQGHALHTHTHTHTHNHFAALWNLSGTTRVSRYQKKHSPTHSYLTLDLNPFMCSGNVLGNTALSHWPVVSISPYVVLMFCRSYVSVSLQDFPCLPGLLLPSFVNHDNAWRGIPLSSIWCTCPSHCTIVAASSWGWLPLFPVQICHHWVDISQWACRQ